MRSQSQSYTIQRLTALWALAESGLGGWMHALKLPFTGIFVGGFAVVIISLLAHYSRSNMRQMLQALGLVLMVKFAVSPQSPPQAYVAVAFQGLMGAVLYRSIGNYTVASLLFGTIAMLESALQKVLFMLILFGESLLQAVDKFFKAIAKDFGLPKDFSFSYWLIAAYIGLYIIWISGLPRRIARQAQSIRTSFAALPAIAAPETPLQKKKGKRWLWPFLLVFIIAVFIFSNDIEDYSKVTYVLLRTSAVLILFFMVLNPMIKWMLERWFKSQGGERHAAMRSLLEMQPEMRSLLRPSWQLAKARKGINRYPAFVLNLVVLSLHPLPYEPTDIHTQSARS
jgi:hypothetical protein